MVRVQMRDATNRDKILVNTMLLPYEPADHKEIRVRRRAKDTRSTSYRIIDRVYEAVEDDASESGIVLYVTEIAK